MALNFPASPTDGQIYYDPSSGNRYVYRAAWTTWLYAANNDPLATSNTQVLYNNQGAIAGSNGAEFYANTLYTANIAVTENVSAKYYFGNGAFLTGVSPPIDLTAANNYAGFMANSANNWANTKVDTITSNSTSRIWANSVVTSDIETVYLDLANTGVTPGIYGNSSIIPSITVDAYGRVTSIANVSSAGGGGASVNVGTTAPVSPTAGNLWWNTDEGVLYIYYTDADSSQWVQASPTTNPQPVATGGYYQGNRGSIGTTDGLSDIFRVHANTITANITIPGGYNALAAGPLTIQTGQKLTVGDGSRVVIV